MKFQDIVIKDNIKIIDLSNKELIYEHYLTHILWCKIGRELEKDPSYTWKGYDKAKLKARHDAIVKEMAIRSYNHYYKLEIDI
jgi:hypothetical protein